MKLKEEEDRRRREKEEIESLRADLYTAQYDEEVRRKVKLLNCYLLN